MMVCEVNIMNELSLVESLDHRVFVDVTWGLARGGD